MPFNIDIELYFWMLDRGEIPDDQRNRVEIERQRVALYREHSQKLENAVYIGKLMLQMRKTVVKKSQRPFTLDPHLYNLKDLTSSQAKKDNWEVVCSELKKFGIRVPRESKERLQQGVHSTIHDLISQIYEYD